jgi:hypothetical protein
VRDLAGRGPWFASLTLAGFYLAAGAAQPPPELSPPGFEPPTAAQAPALNAARASDIGTQLVADARLSYQRVRDYSCTFVKQERIRGVLQPEQVAQMRVRAEPFSVHLKFVGPGSVAGQEVCYVAGRNGGKMRGKAAGLMGAVGFITLDLKDPRAVAQNRHTLDESGIGNLIERIAQGQEAERRAGRAQLRVAEYTFNRRPCVRLEAVSPPSADGPVYAYRCVTYFDKETKLPVRFECYDAPKPGGDPGGELAECYSYIDLHFNLGLGDAAFNH